jgi:Ca2+-transporting ATPase
VLWELAVLALVLGLPGLRHAFDLVPLAREEWFVVLASACSVLPVLELGKVWIRRRSRELL